MAITIATLASRSVTDGVTTNNSPTVTSASAAFTAADVGQGLSGAGIPAGSYIVAINSATSVNINQNATVTASSVSLTIGGPQTVQAAAVLNIVLLLNANNTIKGAGTGVALQAAGATGQVVWQLLKGQPPPGLRFGSDGTLSGIPQAQGRALLTVRAIDSSAPPQFVDQELMVSVI
jgi:hypothetical protein